MYKNYLNKNGEVVKRTFKQLNTTWTKINEYWVKDVTKEEKEFLEKYGLQTTIFNVANLRNLNHVYLTEHYIEICLEHGAKDRRQEE